MRKSLFLTISLIVGLGGNAQAANLALITSPPTMINMLVLFLACAASIVCLRVLSSVRGGYLSRSWQVFLGAFAALALSQLSILFQTLEIIALPIWVSPVLLLVFVAASLYAVMDTKRVLG